MGQKSVVEIVCVNNQFKGGIISKYYLKNPNFLIYVAVVNHEQRKSQHLKTCSKYIVQNHVINYSFLLMFKCNKLESAWELQ
jgi:hypothetical protein